MYAMSTCMSITYSVDTVLCIVYHCISIIDVTSPATILPIGSYFEHKLLSMALSPHHTVHYRFLPPPLISCLHSDTGGYRYTTELCTCWGSVWQSPSGSLLSGSNGTYDLRITERGIVGALRSGLG